MPTKAYIGLPRAGKSYEVVVNVILVALRQGRRVVSNIAGLNYEAMCQILFKEGIAQEHIGKLVLVDHSEVEKPTFWRTDKDEFEGIESFIQPGDLVALDEIWRFWKKRGEIHPRAQNFFRMHGHMPDPKTGLVCEIALITQSIRDINENIRDVVAETYQMVKNTKIGSDKSYIVHVFQRGSTAKADFIRTLPPRFYNPEFFSLYKSHSQHKEGDAQAVEKNPDDRANILKGGFFTFVVPVFLLFGAASLYFLWKFFNPVPDKVEALPSSVVSDPVVAPGHKNSEIVSSSPLVDAEWRVIGWYRTDDTFTVALQGANGFIRTIHNPPVYKLSFSGVEVELPEGGFATPWTAFNSQSKGVGIP